MNRRDWSRLLLGLGIALLVVSLGQYGFMAVRQRTLRQQWNAINTPRAAGPSAAAPLARYDSGAMRLVIPSIHLDDAVVRGTSYQDLLVAPGLLEGTPLPGGAGNSVIAGHRDTFFRHVADLRAGDTVEVRRGGSEYRYRVTGHEIVKPSQTSVLGPTPWGQLTLVTCYPTYWIGPAPERLIVTARLER